MYFISALSISVIGLLLPLGYMAYSRGKSKKSESLANDDGNENHSMPMGLQTGKYGIADRPFYARPLWKKNSAYWSLFSSFIFFPAGLIAVLYRKKNDIPVWLGYDIFLVAFVSVFHHMRAYDEEYDDWLRLIDLVIANSLGVILVVLFWNRIGLWVGMTLVVISMVFLQRARLPNTKSLWHAIFHFLVIATVIYLILR